MKFTKGDTYPEGDCGKFASGISILSDGQYKKPWFNRVECYGDTAQHAEELRDEVFSALASAPYDEAAELAACRARW